MVTKVVKSKSKAHKERFYATGRRKEASARVWVLPGTGQIIVNGKDYQSYFIHPALIAAVKSPLSVTNASDRFDIHCTVKGSGLSGQAGAVHHGISRALKDADPSLKQTLRSGGFLTRDSRKVERKKYGLHKARKATQFSKR